MTLGSSCKNPTFSVPLSFQTVATNSKNTWGRGGASGTITTAHVGTPRNCSHQNQLGFFFPFQTVIIFQEVAFQKYATLLNNCQVKYTYTHQPRKMGPGCGQAEKCSYRCVCVFLRMPVSYVISQAKELIFSQKNLNLVSNLLN